MVALSDVCGVVGPVWSVRNGRCTIGSAMLMMCTVCRIGGEVQTVDARESVDCI